MYAVKLNKVFDNFSKYDITTDALQLILLYSFTYEFNSIIDIIKSCREIKFIEYCRVFHILFLCSLSAVGSR